MNRTDRLYALVEELRARAPRTVRAAELARRFEVSTRTIERDLLALQKAGVPIWAQPGPGGGYGLNVDATLPPLNFTPAEAVAIATALAASCAIPFADAGSSALRKVVAALMPTSRETAARLVSQIRVAQGAGGPGKRVSEVIEQALLDAVAVELAYDDRDARRTVRLVEPVGLFATPSGWFLMAWCRLRQAPRVFRLDRIVRATLTREPIVLRSLDALLPELPFEMAEPVLT